MVLTELLTISLINVYIHIGSAPISIIEKNKDTNIIDTLGSLRDSEENYICNTEKHKQIIKRDTKLLQIHHVIRTWHQTPNIDTVSVAG